MNPKKITVEELNKAKSSLAGFDLKPKEVISSEVLVDFSEPAKAIQWLDEVRSSWKQSGYSPIRITGQIRYYKENQKIELDYSCYKFLLSSKDHDASTNDGLNFECQTPVSGKKAYQRFDYITMAEAIRNQPEEEIENFAKNVLRLIKGTSLSVENGLIGQAIAINCALDFVAFLLTTECLRDSRSKFLAISEFYKLKKGEISIDDLFHPLCGRFVPSRLKEEEFKEKNNGNWTEVPKKKSKVVVKENQGGAQQMCELEDWQIKEHFYDEEMQAIYEKLILPNHEKEKQRKIEDIENMKKNLDESEAEIKEKPNKVELSGRKEVQDAERFIESLCFSNWVEYKFKKAYSVVVVAAISNEYCENSTSGEPDEYFP